MDIRCYMVARHHSEGFRELINKMEGESVTIRSAFRKIAQYFGVNNR